MSIPLRQRLTHDSRCYLWQAPASQRSASPFGSDCAVVAEEYRILESVNYELVTYIHTARLGGSSIFGSAPRRRALTALARSLWCSGERGPVHRQRLRPGPSIILGVHAKSQRELWLIPLVRGLGLLPAIWGSLAVKLRWFGPLLSALVLLLLSPAPPQNAAGSFFFLISV